MSSLKRPAREYQMESYLYVNWWFFSRSCVSDSLIWDHHDTLCTWIHILVYFLTWFSDPWWGVLDMVKYVWRLWVINKGSDTLNKESKHPMWSHRLVILKVFDQSRMIIRKEFLIYHQLNHHLLIKIRIDKQLDLTWFHTHSSSEILFDWRIELYSNLPLKDILIIFYQKFKSFG